jgi:parallel beta-helix repeat protein
MRSINFLKTIGLSTLAISTTFATVAFQLETVAQTYNYGNSGSAVYVNPSQGLDSPDAGRSSQTPFRSISYALQYAGSGSVIYLAQGRYTQEAFPIQLKPGVTLQGDESSQGAGIEIIGGGDYDSRTFARQNATIVTADNSQISGVTVTNPNNRGTGIWIESTSPVIRNSTLANNNREGVFVTGNAAPTIENSAFINNQGNGIAFARKARGELRGNVFERTGFGIATAGETAPMLLGNQIRNNNSGVVLTESSNPILRENTIENNSGYGIVATSKARPEMQGNNLVRNNGEDMLVAVPQGTPPIPSDYPTASNPTPPPQQTTYTPAPISSTPTPTVSSSTSSAIEFKCVQLNDGYATIVSRNNPAVIPQRLINWTRQVGSDWTPQKRCITVTDKMNQIVSSNGGRVDNLIFTVGSVEGLSVVCLAGNSLSTADCSSNNMLFTLSQSNASNSREVIARLSENIRSADGRSIPVEESGTTGQPYASLAPLDRKLEPAPGLWFLNY